MSPPLRTVNEVIRLGDDGELAEAVEVPDPARAVGGIEIHFTTGREAFYPTLVPSPVKQKHGQLRVPIDVRLALWLLVGGCLWALAIIIVFISFGH